ncbi:MAG: hypothetical protein WBB06_14680 [Chitinophagaceae bacterium]
MKKILVLLLMGTTLAAYSQKTDLTTVNTVKPKNGQKMAFEAAYKVHIAKFHSATEKLSVYEIISGPHSGKYHLVNGGRSYADMDKDRADATAHSLDLDKTFFPYLEETMNGTYRFMDSLSIHPDPGGEKCVVTVRTIKSSMEGDYRTESARSAKILSKMKGGFWDNLSVNVFELLWDGSEPIVVSVRNLKDGFKSLETDFYGAAKPGDPSFKDEYIKAYGTLDWDKRVKLLEDAVVKNEQYVMKLRKDLSSQ